MTACDHDWKESYYGFDCTKCGAFGPADMWDDADGDYPSDDWPNDKSYDEDEPWFDCGWVRGMGCTKAGSEECDWECPHRRDFEKGMMLTHARLAKRSVKP